MKALCVSVALALLAAAAVGDQGPDRADDGWAWKPLVRPEAPRGTEISPVDGRDGRPAVGRSSHANPIDAFILAKLREHGMSPTPQADRRTLIRRVCFDLIGLPPTPEEVSAFISDPAPDAYERLVDRLLSSPRYGERWARHWMDSAHFAETHGHDEDKPRDHAWPYRDYLIRSFNGDKPYTRFVEEQIAGDALYPEDPWATVALGFLAAGPWDQSSQMGILDDTLDKKIAQVLDRDDMMLNAIGVLNSVTIHCARCHDHKFDPISLEDYYALQAVFAGVDRAERPYDPDPAVHARRRELTQLLKDLGSGGTDVPLLDGRHARPTPDVQQLVADFEHKRAQAAEQWVVLDPELYLSAGGARITEQADRSLLYHGDPPPAKDTYTVLARTDLRRITAVRIEVLPDPSLPQQGPGRASNGNLHLSEFRLHTAPTGGGEAQAVKLSDAHADFNQDGWTISQAIDGKDETAWGIHPQEGRPHEAVFVLQSPLPNEQRAALPLTFVLEQLHGGSHLIGRLRLSATSVDALLVTPMPGPVAAALSTPTIRRTAEQSRELAKFVLKRHADQELAALPPPAQVYAVTSRFEPAGNFKPAVAPRPVHVLRRGEITQPGDEAAPGALSSVAMLEPRFDLPDPGDEAARRAALARWLTRRDHPLTWRSIVNRVWHHHFGRGIVDTPNDFGRMGGTPSHPELLDWLAVWFRDEAGGSLKRLHRLIVTSGTYRRSSRHHEGYAAIDGDNRLLWRQNRLRLDAEQVRDAVLAMSGQIDLTMGGPSVKQFIQTPGIHVTPNVNYRGFDVDAPANRRRAVYRFLFRTIPDPLMEALDCPSGDQPTPVRAASVTPLQALAMLNDGFIVRQCEHLANRLAAATGDRAQQVRELYRLALLREPTSEESERLAAYAGQHGLAAACRLVINSNEFMFID